MVDHDSDRILTSIQVAFTLIPLPHAKTTPCSYIPQLWYVAYCLTSQLGVSNDRGCMCLSDTEGIGANRGD